jgi:hypothetical protein
MKGQKIFTSIAPTNITFCPLENMGLPNVCHTQNDNNDNKETRTVAMTEKI